MKSRSKMMIIAAIVLLVSLPGCSLKNASETKPIEKSNTVQNTESSRPLPTASKIDPVKAAESEKFFDQGLKLYEQSNYREAIVSFDKAVAVNPDNFKVYTAKGIALCFEGDYKAGMAQIQKTLDMNSGYVPAFYDMAMAYKLQNNYDQSLYWFEKTIQGDPKNTWSYYGIATIHADRGNTQESLKYLRRAIELDPAVKPVARQQSHFDRMRNIPEFQALCANSTTD
ncbi:MAG: ycf3 [Firmicutes bacterium]|nr:ycf3 [Bacillota bacterium]